ncbi:MAG: putative toxin-antitoxin system toxin component, PIN family [Bacillota bacterium]
MIIVIDTNVIVSGLLKASGNPAAIVNYLLSGKIRAAYDIRIIKEYREVLRRPRFNFKDSDTDNFINFIEGEGLLIYPEPLKISLPDPADLPFLETAAAVKSKTLVTGNSKDYPDAESIRVNLVSPANFVTSLSNER